MHVLVTGATGFIGRPLCAELQRRGHQISALARNRAQATVWLPAGTRVIGELSELKDEIPEAIINLAGENLATQRWNPARKQALVESRQSVTRGLVDFMRDSVAKPRVLVSGSAIGWYGARGNEELDEDSASGRDDEFQTQLCKTWEGEALEAERLGVRVCRVRIGLVLEADGGALPKMLLPLKLGILGIVGDGRQWMSWIHRADLISLLIRLCEDSSLSGAFNGTAPNPETNRGFVAALSQALGRPAVLPLPAPLLRLAAGEMSGLLLTGQRVLPRRVREASFGFRHPELGPALQQILRQRTV